MNTVHVILPDVYKQDLDSSQTMPKAFPGFNSSLTKFFRAAEADREELERVANDALVRKSKKAKKIATDSTSGNGSTTFLPGLREINIGCNRGFFWNSANPTTSTVNHLLNPSNNSATNTSDSNTTQNKKDDGLSTVIRVVAGIVFTALFLWADYQIGKFWHRYKVAKANLDYTRHIRSDVLKAKTTFDQHAKRTLYLSPDSNSPDNYKLVNGQVYQKQHQQLLKLIATRQQLFAGYKWDAQVGLGSWGAIALGSITAVGAAIASSPFWLVLGAGTCILGTGVLVFKAGYDVLTPAENQKYADLFAKYLKKLQAANLSYCYLYHVESPQTDYSTASFSTNSNAGYDLSYRGMAQGTSTQSSSFRAPLGAQIASANPNGGYNFSYSGMQQEAPINPLGAYNPNDGYDLSYHGMMQGGHVPAPGSFMTPRGTSNNLEASMMFVPSGPSAPPL